MKVEACGLLIALPGGPACWRSAGQEASAATPQCWLEPEEQVAESGSEEARVSATHGTRNPFVRSQAMAETATKLPVRTEKSAPTTSVGEWAAFDSLRREIDRLFD